MLRKFHIALLVVGAGIVIGVLCSGSSGNGGPGLLVYPGASYLENRTLGDNTTLTRYDLGTANLDDVYNWYKTEMPKQGWVPTWDEPVFRNVVLPGSGPVSYRGYGLGYTKDNYSAGVTIVERIEGHTGTKLLQLYLTPPAEPPEMARIVFSEAWLSQNDEDPMPDIAEITFPAAWINENRAGIEARVGADEPVVVLSVPKVILRAINTSEDPDMITISCRMSWFGSYENIAAMW